MLDNDLKVQLKTYFEMLKENITLQASLDESADSTKMREFLTEISSLSSKVTFNETGKSEYKPSFSIINPNKNININFAAIPLGHEFTSLVLAILQVGGHPIKVEEKLIKMIEAINHKCVFKSYISLSCQNCPDVVQALNIMAVLNPNISSVVIDGALYSEEVEKQNIMAVPTVYLNDKEFYQGRMSLEEILTKLGAFDSEAVNKELNEKEIYDVLIVGGGPAGAAAAIYSARKGISTGIVAERFGGQILDTSDIENFISVKKTEGPKLAVALEEHVKDYNVDIITSQIVAKVEKENNIYILYLSCGAKLKAKTIIAATGARWRKMGVPGEEAYLKKGIAFCPHCDGPLFKGKDIAVIGGGNSGVEAAIDLAGITNHVTLIEFADKLKADTVLQKKLSTLPNVTVIKSAQVSEVYGDGNKLTSIDYIDRKSNEKHNIKLNGIFVQIGLMPNSEWLKDVVEINNHSEIVINDKCQTSEAGIFAAGDVSTVPYKQIIIAMGEGAKASLSAFEYLIRN